MISYALENLKEEELETIVIHEIGHIKRSHVQKILLGWIICMFYYMAFVFGLDSLVSLLILNKAFFSIIRFLILLLGAIQFIFLISYISRGVEIEADLFVLKNGVNREIYENALKSIYALNYIKDDVSNSLEKIQSHPSLKNRIKILFEAEKKEKDFFLPLKKVYVALAVASILFTSAYFVFNTILPNSNFGVWVKNIEKVRIERCSPALEENAVKKEEVNLPAEIYVTDKEEIKKIIMSISRTKKNPVLPIHFWSMIIK
ncbi:hypothetical protein ELD05_11865 [Caldicellulosiruptor changbaiensis]|uniref:Peptidase M48 domain-containing protein n=1 Tax=Caldicellulosiruptor changbaiensis TaxID=1222016 RepID=A0A3T0D8I1_9FIRM|nr:M48 family metalloprotease [Caldicellulosiruptor changbaiensis]AZT91259.1 hypothetical protein ELD05_11865 [Caldicellulosiruptor changbaiensis]